MTVNELYRSFLKELSQFHSNHEASNITSMIFEHFAGIDKAMLIKEPARLLEPDTIAVINKSLDELKLNKPVQYITGEAWFYKMRLKVSPAVLIPRPETEELVEAVLACLKDSADPDIIDIGTGSGCIAIAIKKEKPGAMLTAMDVSPEALEIAKENATNQSTNINFLELDFLAETNWKDLGQYDAIVSNPPYIPANESFNMHKNVTDYEPHTALFVANEQPLIFYERIAAFGKTHLKENGMLFLETHEDFAGKVCNLLNNGIYGATIKKDMYDKPRMIIATRCR